MLTVVAIAGLFMMAPSATADVPLAARLLAEPFATTGVRVNIANLGSQMRGLTNDGDTVYAMTQSGNIVTVPLADVDMTEGQAQQDVDGTHHTVGWGNGGAPNLPGNIDQLSLVYSHGCLFMTDDSNTEGTIKLYCIDVSDWSVTEVAVPGMSPLPAGYYFVRSSLIDFPDGRIGKVSAYTQTGPAMHESTLRTYDVTGTGKNVSLAFSQDYAMQDDSTIYNDSTGWARDEHGIATDGTYLYRIQWNSIVPNTKVWALASGAPGQVVYEGSYTQPFSNMHYLSHNHKDNYYLMGHFWGTEFFITKSADPGPGPGNPFRPLLATSVSKRHGFTTQVTNYDASYTWSAASTAGTVAINGSGLVTVTGLADSQSATITVTATKSGIPDGMASGPGVALGDDANDDGVNDEDQQNVAVVVSPATNKPIAVVLESSDDCEFMSASAKNAADLTKDPAGYKYPLGLVDFTASCGTPGYTATVKAYFYGADPNQQFVIRKYNSVTHTYATITDARLTQVVINGQQVALVQYQVVDGGALDADGLVNGVIVDPVGLALQSVATGDGGLASTGDELKIPLLAGAVLTLLGLGLAVYSRHWSAVS